MADNYDTTIKVGMEADLSGGMQTEKQLDAIRAKAKKLEQESSKSGATIEQAFGRASKAAGLFRKVLTGFGVVGAIMGLVEAIGKVRDSFGAAKKEADALAKAKEKAEHKAAVDSLAKSYDALADSISAAAEAERHRNEVQDIELKGARELEDAQLKLAELRELDAVDPNDPAAAEQRAAISARYARKRGELTAGRSEEDIQRQAGRLYAEADRKRAAAAEIVSSTAEDDRLIAAANARLQDASLRSVSANEEDATGFWSQVGQNAKNIVTLNWGKVGDTDSVAGDKVRAEASAEAEEAKAEVKRLKEQKEAKLKEAEKLRMEATRLDERRNAVTGTLDAARVRSQVALAEGLSGQASANRALDRKEAKIAADESTIAQGPGRIAALKRKIADVEAQKSSAISADSKEQMDAEMARQALASFDAAGYRRNGTGVQARRGALEADVERETAEANQSRAQLQSTLATLAATLKGLNSDLKKVEREVDAAVKRQNAVNEEAPAS